MKKKHLNIGQAVDELEKGKRVRRSSWAENRKFIFQQVPSAVTAVIVPKMTSLPQTVKDYFQGTFDDESAQLDDIYYMDQIAEVGLSNTIRAYAPSVGDLFARDWEVLD